MRPPCHPRRVERQREAQAGEQVDVCKCIAEGHSDWRIFQTQDVDCSIGGAPDLFQLQSNTGVLWVGRSFALGNDLNPTVLITLIAPVFQQAQVLLQEQNSNSQKVRRSAGNGSAGAVCSQRATTGYKPHMACTTTTPASHRLCSSNPLDGSADAVGNPAGVTAPRLVGGRSRERRSYLCQAYVRPCAYRPQPLHCLCAAKRRWHRALTSQTLAVSCHPGLLQKNRDLRSMPPAI